jgi:hypothetical protein
VYEHPVIVNNNVRVSFNGGSGGVRVRPRPAELAALREPHAPPMKAQIQIERAASTNKANFVAVNHGRPASLVIEKPLPADHNVRPVAAPAPRVEAARQEHPAVEAHPAPAAPEHRTPEARPAPAARPEAHTAEKPVQHNAAKPDQHTAERPVQHEAEKPVQHVEKPAPHAAERPAPHAAEKPAPHAAEKPAAKPKPSPDHQKKAAPEKRPE